jgi:hypothetical protein
MSQANETRRQVMLIAWDLHRADAVQPFAECLRGAWKFMRALVAYMPFRRVREACHLTPGLIVSPIAGAVGSHRFGARSDFRAGRLTARLGV